MTRRRARTAWSYVLVALVCLPFALPLLWLFFGAGKTTATFFDDLWLPPADYRWSNFSEAWTTGQVGTYVGNSVFVTLMSLAGVVLVGFPLAYAVARIRFPGDRVVLGVFAASLFVPVQIFVVSLFDVERALGILDSHWAMIFPYVAMNLPFAVLFFTAFLRAVPKEIEEAAVLDGASRVVIMWRVMAPLSRPAFATVAMFTFLSVWNEFLIALTVTQSPSVRTLPLGLLNFSQQFGQRDYPQLFAALVLSAVPIIAVFVIGQRQFLRGLSAGAVKA